MTAKTNAERQREFYARMKAAGFKKVPVWVPANRVKDIHKVAEEMRREVEKVGGKGNGDG